MTRDRMRQVGVDSTTPEPVDDPIDLDQLTLGEVVAVRVARPTRHDRVDAAVLAWGRWYTRDLDEAVAVDRRAELESDLYEQRAFAAEAGEDATSGAIVSRALRGIPADLAWRHARLRRQALSAPSGTLPLAMPALAHLATALLVAWGVVVVMRTVAAMAAGAWAGAWDLVAAGVVGLAMALLGAAFTTVPRYRWLGALWLAVASYVLIRFGMYALIASSTTLGEFYRSSLREAILVNRVMVAAGVLFFVAMAAWWLPSAMSLWTRGSRPSATEFESAEGVAA